MPSQPPERDRPEARASRSTETLGDRIRLIVLEVAVYAIMITGIIAAARGPGVPLG